MPRIKNFEQSVYVMEAPTGETKIGVAKDPRARFLTMKFCFPRGELKMVFVSEVSAKAWAIEEWVHAQLQAKQLNGEWFEVAPDIAVQLIGKGFDPKNDEVTAILNRTPYVQDKSAYLKEYAIRQASSSASLTT